jgi:D-sedoheptulose 7-phosphate isomerase
MMLHNLSSYLKRLNQALSETKAEDVIEAIQLIQKISDASGRVWIIGNGGSALTSSHFATDLSRCSTTTGEPIQSISLCDNIGILTALSNDFSYEEVFVMQLQRLYARGDLFISISASGNSRNIIKCLEFAKNNEIYSIAFTGFDGGRAKRMCDLSIHVPTHLGDYGIAEDAHSVLTHFICGELRR